MALKICTNGHRFEKTSDCPVCPVCSSKEMQEQFGAEFPKIGAPALRALASIGIYRMSELTKVTEQELLDLHGFGPKALRLLRQKLHDQGLSFKKEALQNDNSVKDYIDSLKDEQSVQDSHVLTQMMQRISRHDPKLWNVGTIGFDTYHYKYDSGREGDGLVIGFYPRKGKITIYLMDGTARYSELLAKLGKHTMTGYCLYIKRLNDIELPVLEQIIGKSYAYIKAKSKDGPIDRILWQTEK